jgi:hypothetical protein
VKTFPFGKKATAARNWKGNHHAIAGPQFLYLAPGLDDFPHELVTENIAFLHRRDKPIVEMEIRAADCRRSNFHNRILTV